MESLRSGAISRAFRVACFLVALAACALPARAGERKRTHLHHAHRMAMWIPNSPSAAPQFLSPGFLRSRHLRERASVEAPLSDLDRVSNLRRDRVFAIVAAHARTLGVPVPLALAVTRYESGGDCRKIGGIGELGPMQVRPETARAMGLQPRDCAEWIDAGLKYLRVALETQGRYGLEVALSAYNHGVGFAKPTRYGAAVLRNAKLSHVPL